MNSNTKWKQTHEARQRERGFSKIHDTWAPEERKATVKRVAALLRQYPNAQVEVHVPGAPHLSEVVE